MIRLITLIGLFLLITGCQREAVGNSSTSSPATKGATTMPTELATFGAGCFWHTEDDFRQVPGVINVAVGYTGGKTKNPTYEDVCSHTTGHVEAAQVEYDPSKTSYEKLLDAFWEMHDPTQMNRQGPDVGWQYRSVIYYHTAEQKAAAEAAIARLNASGKYSRPIATAVEPATTFWKAEEYHQMYLAKHGRSACPVPGR